MINFIYIYILFGGWRSGASFCASISSSHRSASWTSRDLCYTMLCHRGITSYHTISYHIIS